MALIQEATANTGKHLPFLTILISLSKFPMQLLTVAFTTKLTSSLKRGVRTTNNDFLKSEKRRIPR